MPKRNRSPKLDTPTARARLRPRARPYFVQVGVTPSGHTVALGYRPNKRGPGTWTRRISDGHGGKGPERQIGVADDLDFAAADGEHTLTYWQAVERALAEARLGEGAASIATVAAALAQYEKDLASRSGDKANATRVKRHVPEALAHISIAELSGRDLQSWRDALAKKLSPASVNRTTNAFKAALNSAADHDERVTNRPWKTALGALRGAQQSRNVVLEEATIRRIIAEAKNESPEFGLFVTVAAQTGARPSQIARLSIHDLQDARRDLRLMMPSSRKGHGSGGVQARPVPISAGLAAQLRAAAHGRPGYAPLLIKPNGTTWRRTDHGRLFAKAVRRADLDPAHVTLYSLRHSSITRRLLSGAPIRLVAALHDTSALMIERTYSHYIGDHADEIARKGMLDIPDEEPTGTVVRLPAAG